MLTPWVNITLLILVLLQAVTGYLGMTSNRPPEAWLLWLHGIGAYSIIVLMFMKTGIIVDAWRRKKHWTGRRYGFLILLLFLIVTTVLGLVWTFSGPSYLGSLSIVSLHIYVAVPVLFLMAWHARHMRFIWRVPGATGRRLFLGSAVTMMGGLIAWLSVDRVKAWRGWPGASRRFTGSYEAGSFSGQFPSVSWISDRPLTVAVDNWLLRVEGAVERSFELSYADLTALPGVDVEATLDCTGGWYTVQLWRGVLLNDLLALAVPKAEAASVTLESVTGYQRRFSLDDAGEMILAMGTLNTPDGVDVGAIYRPLNHGNGFPLRLVAPHERGVEWVKWIAAVRVNSTGPNWQLPLPLQ